VRSTVNGDYKFPGGGVQPGERHGDALARQTAALRQFVSLFNTPIL